MPPPAACSQKLAETPLQPLDEELEENESLHRWREPGLGEPGLESSSAGRREEGQHDLLLPVNMVPLLGRRPSCHAHSQPHDTVTWIAPVYHRLDLPEI